MPLELAHVQGNVHVGVEEGTLDIKLVQDQVEYRCQRNRIMRMELNRTVALNTSS